MRTSPSSVHPLSVGRSVTSAFASLCSPAEFECRALNLNRQSSRRRTAAVQQKAAVEGQRAAVGASGQAIEDDALAVQRDRPAKIGDEEPGLANRKFGAGNIDAAIEDRRPKRPANAYVQLRLAVAGQ